MNSSSKASKSPRGRMSAYAFFLQINRQELKQKYPNEPVSFVEFSKKCGEKWKTMDERAKERFHDLAERDKQRLDLEMANYVPPEKKAAKRKRDPDAPKHPLSSYFWFCHDERADVKAALGNSYSVGVFGEVGKELGRRWAAVTPQQKAGYDLLAANDKQRYEKEMQVYNPKVALASHPPAQIKGLDADVSEDGEEEENMQS